MPPRKSTSRKSDVSTARVVPVEATPPKEPTPAPAADEPVVAAAEDSPGAEKKDKDKEKEKEKEREKEKEKERNDAIAIEDLTLPKSIITRLAKGVLPANTQIQANAILAMSNSATVFISYLASHANENTVNAGKKTVTPADVFKALEDTEFSFLRAPLEAEFAKFNAIQTEKRTSYRQKVRAKKSDDPDTSMADTSQVDADTTMASEASGPRTKRARVDPSAAAEVEDDAETEDEEPVPEDDDEDNEEEEEDDDEGEGEASGDETQDALEEKEGRDDADEALDGDESD
ncbi:histone-fold-containing protein [Ilyonectria robusta]|uniref:histone-fold-containing protein n=1 Tax=Ilyonectria robusta TaxID=1079257 RepID=UPI001E8D824D|nr:histone-fold-containing protein [Ilyonectria robusta]KAH8736842.1 histone-fold-containing protein [Ilyonectria robusta]